MKYIVLVKQVPDITQITGNVFNPETGNLNRGVLPSVINKLDADALAFADTMRQYSPGKIVCLTMGPPMAVDVLKGGYYAIPRYHQQYRDGRANNTIGYNNVLIVGDSAGFVNMHKMKGIHIAVESGVFAGKAAARCMGSPDDTAAIYTGLLEKSPLMKEMKSSRNFRSIVAMFGPITGLLFSIIGKFLPKIDIGKDSKSMTKAMIKYVGSDEYDKTTFVSLTGVEHREDQPSHLSIIDNNICNKECDPRFGRPCIGFCPAGVYDKINSETVPANPSNCIHCKTCQIKCPYDNIGWTVPEGGGGPRYKHM